MTNAVVASEAESLAVSTPSGTKEACLDMLLPEELSVDRGFAKFVVTKALLDAGCPAPEGQPSRVVVTFNYWHELGDDYGENDLDVELAWPGGAIRAC